MHDRKPHSQRPPVDDWGTFPCMLGPFVVLQICKMSRQPVLYWVVGGRTELKHSSLNTNFRWTGWGVVLVREAFFDLVP